MKNSEVLTVGGFASMLAGGDKAAAAAIKVNIEKAIGYFREIGVERADALVVLEIFYKMGIRTDGLSYVMTRLAEEAEAEAKAKAERSIDSIDQLESELIEALELAQQEIRQAVDNFKATAERVSREMKDMLDRHGKT